MLRKLLKYEFQATGRVFIPLYGALFIIALIQRVFLKFNLHNMSSLGLEILSLIVPTVFGVMICAVLVVTFVMMIQRFYKNLLGREGYLMFTLPVSTSKLIWSKLIVIMVWTILSIIAAVLAFAIVFLDSYSLGQIIADFIANARMLLKYHLIVSALEIMITLIVGTASSILSIYLSMAIGQLANKHKVLCSVGAYIGISIIINNIILAIIAETANTVIGRSIYGTLFINLDEIQAGNVFVLMVIAFLIIQAAVYFLITKHILTKKLNLE